LLQRGAKIEQRPKRKLDPEIAFSSREMSLDGPACDVSNNGTEQEKRDAQRTATIPIVTDPPAEERPPIILPPITPLKLVARAQTSIEILVSPSEACMIGHLPSFSDHGAQNSHLIVYGIRKVVIFSRALEMPKEELMLSTTLE
jgi:hypothetical protein